MRTTGKRRRGIAAGWPAMVAIAAIAAAEGVAIPTARAQQPMPDRFRGPQQAVTPAPFGESARTPMELWETADYLIRTNRAVRAEPYLERFRKSRPIDLWATSDYLIRTGQGAKALPYLDQLLKDRPDDATWIAIREKFGAESFQRLADHPATRPFAQPVSEALAAAERRIPPMRAEVPGPELFAKEPRTPLELWEAADYLVRTGQAPKAVPYLDRFQKSRPDDATLVAVRDRYGLGSFMRLDDHPMTKPFAQPLSDALAAAVRRYATRPDRIARFITDLTRTPEEQGYALRRLWEAGAYAVPPLIEALRRPGLSRDDHALLLTNIGRLQPSAVPTLATVLESSDPALAADAATALGSIGDATAVPFLTFPAVAPTANPAMRSTAQAAIERLTGRPFTQQPKPPVRVLTDTAWSYHRGQSDLPDETVVLWSWDDARKVPAPREVTAAEARTELGLRFARQALRLDPADRSAQVAQLSLALDRAAGRVGPEAVEAQDPATFAAATTAGPALLAQVLETAIADHKPNLAAAAVLALAKVTDRSALTGSSGRPHPLVRALSAPGRRASFAAARAIVNLAPDRPFAGSSLVAPALARFVVNQPQPRAVIIDGNVSRASRLAESLMNLGYVTEVESMGSDGFLAAAESADVELVLVSYDLHQGWGLTDTLANLQADARTASIPLYVFGPYDIRYTRPNLEHDFPGIHFLVPSAEPVMVERQLGGRPAVLTEAERLSYAREAAALLARIAADRRGPISAGLRTVEPALAVALLGPETARSAAAALAELPAPGAQRNLFNVAMDPSRPADLRSETARLLIASIRRFGPLLTRDQEARLVASLGEEPDPGVHEALSAVLAALKPGRPPAAAPGTPGVPTAPPAAAPTAPNSQPRPQPGAP
jgi:hypothetical protein